MISFEHVSAGYEDKDVLHDINLSFKQGKVTVLVGPNGCGKSTLLKALVRINPHSKGRICIKNKDLSAYKTIDLAKEIAYLSQSKNVPEITVLKMVLHGRFAYLNYPRRYRKEDYDMAKKALQWVGMSDMEDVPIHKLSGGMRQKVYIAMALAQDTPIILMDEPTTYLDIYHQLKTLEMARELAEEGKTIIMVLHDLSQALRIADELVVLEEGRQRAIGSPKEIYESGIIEEVFGIVMKQIETENGYHYICDIDQRVKGENSMPLFPFFMDITGKKALLIGGGKHALEKVEKLRPFDVCLTVIAKDACQEIREDSSLTWLQRDFCEADLTEELVFVIAATEDANFNHHIYDLCQKKRILVNVVDDQPYCQFVFPSLITRGNLTVGICTNGASPAVGVRLRKQVEEILPDQTEEILDWLALKRAYITAHISNGKRRFAFYHKLAGICMDENRILSETEFLELLEKEEGM